MKTDDRKVLRFFFTYLIPLILLVIALDKGGREPSSKEMISLVLWGTGLMVLFGLREHIKVPRAPAVLFSALWLWGILSFLHTWSPDATLRFVLQFGGMLAFGWGIYQIAEKPLENFFRALFVGIGVFVLIGYFFLIGARTGLFVGRHDMLFHFISTFYWKNPTAGFICLFLPLLFVLAKHDPKKGWRIFYWIFGILSFAALLLTRSRGGWLAFALAAILSAAFLPKMALKHSKVIIAILIIGFALSIIVMPPGWLIERFRQVEEIAKSSPSEPVAERWMMLDMGKRVISAYPLFGVGFGAFKIAYPHFLKSSHYLSTQLHNQYLQFAVEGGIPAALLFLGGIVSVLVIIFRGAAGKRDPILWGIGAGALAYAIHIGLDFDWDFWATSLTFIALAAVGLRNAQTPEKFSFSPALKAVWGAILSIGFLLSVAIAIAWTFYSGSQAEISTKKEIAKIKTALKFDPISAYLWYQLGSLQKTYHYHEEALESFEKAYRLEPKNVQIMYEYGLVLYEKDPKRAEKILEDAVKWAPYVLPDKQLQFADLLYKHGKVDEAQKVLENITENFAAGENVRYSEFTVSYRYVIGRAYEYLGDIALQKGELEKAEKLYRKAHEFECPRYKDQLAKIWGIDTPAPEWIVFQLIDAVNVGDTLTLRRIIADSAMVRLSEGLEMYLEGIMDVKVNMIEGKASVDALVMKVYKGEVYDGFLMFNLVLTDRGWQVKF